MLSSFRWWSPSAVRSSSLDILIKVSFGHLRKQRQERSYKGSGEHCGGRREGPRPKQRFSRAYAHGRLDDLRPSCHPLTRPTLLAPTFQNTPSSFAKQRNAALLLQLHLRHRRRPPRSLFRVKQHRRGRTKIRTPHDSREIAHRTQMGTTIN